MDNEFCSNLRSNCNFDWCLLYRPKKKMFIAEIWNNFIISLIPDTKDRNEKDAAICYIIKSLVQKKQKDSLSKYNGWIEQIMLRRIREYSML